MSDLLSFLCFSYFSYVQSSVDKPTYLMVKYKNIDQLNKAEGFELGLQNSLEQLRGVKKYFDVHE